MRILVSTVADIATNLAIEEVLLGEVGVRGPALLVSRNRPSVVFGRNQNAWREAAPGRLAAPGIRAARRSTGGGTVYHDEGCLNFSFVLPRPAFDRDRQFRLLLRVLAELGVRAERVRDTSLAVAGLKVSGNAFTLRRDAALHHGTLLFSSDLAAMRRALASPAWTVTGRGIPSIRMPVANLRDLAPEATESRWIERLGEAALAEWGGGSLAEWGPADSVDPEAVARHRAKWLEWDRVWGGSPPCQIEGRAVLPAHGAVHATVALRGGRIQRVRLRAESGLAPEAQVAAAWTGCRFDPETLPNPPVADPEWAFFLICFSRGEAYLSPSERSHRG